MIRSWFISDYEKGYGAISFYIPEKPESRVLLTEDSKYDKTYNFHIESGSSLSDPELDFIVSGVIDFIEDGWNLTTCGESDEEKLRLYRKFHSKLQETDCVRILKDGWDKHSVYLKILKKKG